MSVIEAFSEVAESLAKMAPERIAELKASHTMTDRVEILLRKKQEDSLTRDEAIELERYLSLDLLINLAKARAKTLLAA